MDGEIHTPLTMAAATGNTMIIRQLLQSTDVSPADRVKAIKAALEKRYYYCTKALIAGLDQGKFLIGGVSLSQYLRKNAQGRRLSQLIK